jgi:subtilase family serine protease
MKNFSHKAWLRAVLVGITAVIPLALMLPARGSTQQRAAIVGNHPSARQFSGWVSASSDLPLHMVAVLGLRNTGELEKLKAELQQPGSPNYHRWLGSHEFAQRFGPTQDELRAVTGWLSANGFAILSADLATREVHFTGTAAQAEQAMGVRIVSNDAQYANLGDPQVPSELSGTIVAFFGLSNFATASQSKAQVLQGGARPNATIDGKTHFGPSDFWLYYDESDPTGTGANGGTGAPDCIGILEIATEPTIPSPAPTSSVIDIFTTQFNLPPAQLNIILTDEKSQPAQPSDNEPVLDVDWAHAVAPNTPINLYVSTIPGTTTAALDTLSLAVSQNTCGAISSSVDDEGSTCPDLAQVQAFAQVSAQAVTQGQTLFHSSGDYGSFYPCGQPGTSQGETEVQPSVEESSANADVTVVGGTQFNPVYDANGNNTSVLAPGFEQVWQEYTPLNPVPTPTPKPAKGTSGGGVSVVFPVPSWQQGITPFGASGPLTMRGVPDVSAGASPNMPGYWIASTSELTTCPSGQTTCFLGDGGTSASAPIWAGISRLLAEKLNTTRLGNINPQLYRIAAANSGALVDVSMPGNNCTFATCSAYPGYQVGPGYDLGTGLGSPDINKLLVAFQAPTAGAVATASNTASSGTAGKTVNGGTLTVSNTSGADETISTINLTISKPGLFAALSLSAAVNGGTAQDATSGTIGSTTTFTFNPALSIPVDGSAVFTLSATLGGSARAEGTIRFAGVMAVPGGWRGGMPLALALCLTGLAMLAVKRSRRRMLFGALALLLIAAAQAGCGGGSRGGGVTGKSQQTVADGGIAVSTSGGAVIVQGLPATMGTITLKN